MGSWGKEGVAAEGDWGRVGETEGGGEGDANCHGKVSEAGVKVSGMEENCVLKLSRPTVFY